MHELSIARLVVELAAEQAEQVGASRIAKVNLRVGALTSVHRSALEFGFAVASSGTMVDGAELQITMLPVAIYCPRCGIVVDLPGIQQMKCPVCGEFSGDVRQGQELELESIEVVDEP
jgi:hydrogenase nickel incorporation protein HypA/HybF